jgi:DNA-binding NtrC family response regulator
VASLAPEALAALEQRRWRHNVRELEAVVMAAAQRAGAESITASHLGELEAPSGRAPTMDQAKPASAPTAGLTLDALERAYIENTLQAVGWHQGRAAEALGISPKTLYRKIREYGFTRPSGRTMR